MSLFRQKTSFFTSQFFQVYKKLKNKLAPEESTDVNEQLVIKLSDKKFPSLNQLKQLPKFLNKIEKIELYLALFILISSSLLLAWKVYAKNSIKIPDYGGEYSEGLIGAPNLINPMLAANDVDRDLVKLIFSGLMRFDANGELAPDLASGYTIDAQQTTYTFELRNDLKWHDGTPITADDVIFTISSIKNSDYKSPFKNSFNGVSVERINDSTVQFKLEKPFSPFLSILTIGIIPEHLWYSIPAFGANLADLNIKPIGSGPYKFKSLTRDSSGNVKSYALEAYEDYHFGQPFIKDFNLKFYPDFETGVSALKNKNVEGLIYLPKEFKAEFTDKRITLHSLQFPQYTAIFYNPKNNDALNNSDFRKALALSVNKQRILDEVLQGDGQIIDTPILLGLLGHDQNIKAPQLHIDEAKKILDSLGWKIQANDTYRSKGEGEQKQNLNIKITSIDQSENVKILSILQESWQSIGINVELEIISKDRIKKEIIEPRNYQILVFGQVINVNSGPYPFWHSSQNQNPGLNLSVLANKDVDTYLETARNAKTNEEKLEPLKKFQEKLLELNFAIFLYNQTYTYPIAGKIKGLDKLKFINLPSDRFNEVHLWYSKTKRTFTDNDSSSQSESNN
ncbi:MAG: peptide ABC transporter substrate-binding protein [bacterium]|nr:peptide ABC transporter substrate-binding protein [bacterium]